MKYSITEKEALNLVWCIEKAHFYLYGKRFDVIVDYQPLKYIFLPISKLKAHISKWQIKLREYNFNVVYKKGSTNIADYLSRKCQVTDESGSDEVCLYINYLSKAMLLHQVMNESKKIQKLLPYEELY